PPSHLHARSLHDALPILRDVVHKTLGKRLARTVVVTAAAVNLFLAAYLQWVAGVRPDPSYGLDAEFRAVLGPLWRIVVASIVAQDRKSTRLNSSHVKNSY